MWLRWEGVREEVGLRAERRGIVLRMQPGEEIRSLYVRPDWVETELRYALMLTSRRSSAKGPGGLLFQVGSQEDLYGCLCKRLCHDEAQRPSGVATRMRRRRCVKRYATAKAGSHSDATLIPLGRSWWEKATELSKA